MAYEYDRVEGEDGSGAFLMGLLAGTVLGAGLGMLFAPKTGTELRSNLTDAANRWQRTAADTYQQATERVGEVVERGREAYDRTRESVTRLADQGREYATGTAGTAGPGTEFAAGGDNHEFGNTGTSASRSTGGTDWNTGGRS